LLLQAHSNVDLSSRKAAPLFHVRYHSTN
jgi:hypothetical protein